MEAPETWPEFNLDNFRKWFFVEYIDMVYDLINTEQEINRTIRTRDSV